MGLRDTLSTEENYKDGLISNSEKPFTVFSRKEITKTSVI